MKKRYEKEEKKENAEEEKEKTIHE